jgi:hypothetical protein
MVALARNGDYANANAIRRPKSLYGKALFLAEEAKVVDAGDGPMERQQKDLMKVYIGFF